MRFMGLVPISRPFEIFRIKFSFHFAAFLAWSLLKRGNPDIFGAAIGRC
jgi:hypothetical protein